MTHITIIRHAEAEGNFYRRVHGHYDGLVTPNGEAQLDALRGRFQNTVFDAVYASDLYRTRRTASVLRTVNGQEVQPLRSLREVNLGDWEDVPWGELAVADPERLSIFMRQPGRFASRGRSGETMVQAQARIVEAVRGLARVHMGQRIAVVSHGLVIRTLMASLKNVSIEDLHEIPHCDNTAVSCVTWDGEGTPCAIVCGDNTHLGELSTLGRQYWWRNDKSLTDTNLWFQPAMMPCDLPRTLAWQKEAWMTVYGSLMGFNDALSNAQTERMAAAHPRAIVFAMADQTPVGLLQLDTEALTTDNTGHISLVFLTPEVRGKSLGAQLIGHAVSVYRALGRSALRLRVFEGNLVARQFYKKVGFCEEGREDGQQGSLIVMKMGIEV